MKILDINELLQAHPTPAVASSWAAPADGQKAVIIYFIMGRSGNSRNRIFEATGDGIRTRAYDESKMVDPSLIIYHPVRQVGEVTVVTNGDQTDTIRDSPAGGQELHRRPAHPVYEPDGPNYTPRISGVVDQDGSFCLSILKSADGDPACSHRYFYEYDAPLAGEGLLHPHLPGECRTSPFL